MSIIMEVLLKIMKNQGAYGMRKLFHYLGNIAGIILALAAYSVLQTFYFFPRRIHKLLHLNVQIQCVMTALITVILLAVVFWLYKRQLREFNDWDFNSEPHWDWRRILIAVVGIVLITLLSYAMMQLVSGGKTISANQKELNRISLQSGNLYKIMVCFVAPFCEETIFRGMFFNTFFTRNTFLNKWVGILVSGFVFAYMHDPRLTKFILVYWVLGCVLGWVYMTTKDLRYSMMTHMAYNLLGFL